MSSHKNDPKRGAQETGQPLPGKDRTKHEQARGVKMSLDSLKNQKPTREDINKIMDRARAQSDRGAVVMASTLVEYALYEAIKMRAPHIEDESGWFEGPAAPFKSFDARIRFAYALQILTKEEEEHLHLVRDARNVFAHNPGDIDLSHPALFDICDRIVPGHDLVDEPRVMFAYFCQNVTRGLLSPSNKSNTS